MRTIPAPQGGLVEFQSLSRRQRIARRKVYAVSAIAGLALLSGVIGALSRPGGETNSPIRSGPFSYFPSE